MIGLFVRVALGLVPYICFRSCSLVWPQHIWWFGYAAGCLVGAIMTVRLPNASR